MDSVWLCREGIPGLAAGLDNCFGVVEHAEGKEALAEIKPDPLDRVEFRTVGWQRHQRDVVRNGERALVVPTGAVEGMAAWTSSGRIAAKRARNRSMTLALTVGSTRVKSSPVAGHTAVKM